MRKRIDLTGQRFGKLVVVQRIEKPESRRTMWKCICDCGKEHSVTQEHLSSGHTKSCGCLKKKYNISDKRIFSIWMNMKARCDKPNRKDRKYYYEKGITYCVDWKDYSLFEKWALENGYEDNLTLDRIDDTGNYEPSNCQWITFAEQQKRKSGNTWITHDGQTKTLSDWAREFDVHPATLKSRLDLGYSFEEALLKKKRINKTSIVVDYKGEKMSITQLSEKLNVSVSMVSKRLKKGDSIEEIIEVAELIAKKRKAV